MENVKPKKTKYLLFMKVKENVKPKKTKYLLFMKVTSS